MALRVIRAKILSRIASPGELNALPGAEVGVNLPPRLLEFDFDLLDFLLQADPHGVRLRVLAKLIQLALQFDDRLLEIELMFHARGKLSGGGRTGNVEFPTESMPNDRV